jgi:hypothetical protein
VVGGAAFGAGRAAAGSAGVDALAGHAGGRGGTVGIAGTAWQTHSALAQVALHTQETYE